MGRLLLFLGIVLVVLGGAGVVVGVIGIPLQFASTITNAVTPSAAELCKPGETLQTERGADEYTPGEGYRHSERYFCVNSAGVRREVTETFVKGILGDVFGSLGTLFIPALASCVCTIGVLLTVVGALLSRRRALAASAGSSRFVFPDEP